MRRTFWSALIRRCLSIHAVESSNTPPTKPIVPNNNQDRPYTEQRIIYISWSTNNTKYYITEWRKTFKTKLEANTIDKYNFVVSVIEQIPGNKINNRDNKITDFIAIHTSEYTIDSAINSTEKEICEALDYYLPIMMNKKSELLFWLAKMEKVSLDAITIRGKFLKEMPDWHPLPEGKEARFAFETEPLPTKCRSGKCKCINWEDFMYNHAVSPILSHKVKPIRLPATNAAQ